ncbi:MAG: hypothetical protein N2712_01130 [Brevinematales bacterium]|nr:hypothetical protein [Brevinematales bacterium]
MIREKIIIVFLMLSVNVFGFLIDMSETNREYFEKIINSTYINLSLPNLEVYSTYIQEFSKEYIGIDKVSSFLILSNNSLILNITNEKTNINLSRLTIPFMEGMEVLYLLPTKEYQKRFVKFQVANYGDTKILSLWQNEKTYIVLYIAENLIQRVDYWLKENNDNIMLWSYLCAYRDNKKDRKTISGILFNIQAKEFYKFDFRPLP